jgi:hypothetical protein
VNRLVELDARSERGDDDGHLPLGADLEVMLEAVVGAVDDLVDRKGGRRTLGVIAVPRGKRLADLVQPFVEQGLRPGVQRREASDNPRRALGNHQLWVRDDEHRRADRRDPQALKERRKRHQRPW